MSANEHARHIFRAMLRVVNADMDRNDAGLVFQAMLVLALVLALFVALDAATDMTLACLANA